MKNVCAECKWMKQKRNSEWYCIKYGINMYRERIYCVANEKRRGERETGGGSFDPDSASLDDKRI